ncbi:hypothetical protein GCM10017708_01870 [Arthrobacter citreus]
MWIAGTESYARAGSGVMRNLQLRERSLDFSITLGVIGVTVKRALSEMFSECFREKSGLWQAAAQTR